MGLTDRAKEIADAALLKAGKVSERAAGRAAELSGVAREKAPGYVDRAADLAVKAVDGTASRVDRATGGRFHDKLEGATAKVQESLDRPRPDQPTQPAQPAEPVTPSVTNPEATDPDGPAPR